MFLRIGTFFLLVASLLAQAPKPGSADGIVTNAVTGQPVKRALLKFSAARRVVGCSAITDSLGRFHCDSIPPGRYRVTADAEGYAARAYAPKIVAIAAEQTEAGIALTLVPLGVITGRITDDSGQPIAGAAIVAQNAARLFWGGGAMSDDRGRYRIINLQPGRYYLKVSMLPGDETGSAPHPNLHHLSQQQMYPETYYPNAASLDAAVAQRVDPGAELTADFRLPKLPAYHIRGRLTGAMESGMTVSIAPCSEPGQSTADDDDDTFAFRGSVAFFAPIARPTGLSAGNGDFDIGGVVSGEYSLTARASRVVPGPRVSETPYSSKTGISTRANCQAKP